MRGILDHPDIRRVEQTGYVTRELIYPHCPFCGEVCSDIYRDMYGNVVGCENCIKTENAWEAAECFPERI